MPEVKKPVRRKKRRNRAGGHNGGAPFGNKNAAGNTVYLPEYVETARKLCLQFGATDADLAQYFGVTTNTIWAWKGRHPEFANALVTAKEVANQRVQRATYHRAVGYEYEEEKVFANGYRAKVKTYVPPDSTAAQFWLCNRDPENWRHASRMEHTGAGGTPLQAPSFEIAFNDTPPDATAPRLVGEAKTPLQEDEKQPPDPASAES